MDSSQPQAWWSYQVDKAKRRLEFTTDDRSRGGFLVRGPGSSQDGRKWLITMVIVSPLRIGVFPLQMAVSWLINGGY